MQPLSDQGLGWGLHMRIVASSVNRETSATPPLGCLWSARDTRLLRHSHPQGPPPQLFMPSPPPLPPPSDPPPSGSPEWL